MSHMTRLEIKMTNKEALMNAARRATVKLDKHSNLTIIRFPGWLFCLFVDDDGNVSIDSDEVGSMRHLDRLKQLYAAEYLRLTAEKQGHKYFEEELEDGTIKCTVDTGESDSDWGM